MFQSVVDTSLDCISSVQVAGVFLPFPNLCNLLDQFVHGHQHRLCFKVGGLCQLFLTFLASYAYRIKSDRWTKNQNVTPSHSLFGQLFGPKRDQKLGKKLEKGQKGVQKQ